MAVATPPRFPDSRDTQDLEALDALIEEARKRARRRRLGYAAAALAAGALALGVVSYFGARGSERRPSSEGAGRPSSAPPPRRVANGPLTVIDAQGISALRARARLVPFLHCRSRDGCYDLESIAWSPDGRRLAFTATTVGAASPGYNGLHVYEPATRLDRRISWLEGFSIAWSPDGSELALVFPSSFSNPWGAIDVLGADGSHRRELRTGSTGRDASPTWSPDGRQLAFSTVEVDWNTGTAKDSTLSVIGVDGSHRRLLARHAWWPRWSPDGSRIAYRSACGTVRLVTPGGVDVTPATPAFDCGSRNAVRGRPVWSPDGRKLAVSGQYGIYVLDLRRPAAVELKTAFVGGAWVGRGVFGSALPAWRPVPRRS